MAPRFLTILTGRNLKIQQSGEAEPPTLTRRRSAEHRQECWHIYCGDVHVGTIAERVGNPHDTDPWEWSCGFYPGSHPGEHQSDTTATFEEARADFERAWQVFCRTAPRPIFKNGAMSAIGPNGNLRCGMLAGAGDAQLWTRQAVQPLPAVPLR